MEVVQRHGPRDLNPNSVGGFRQALLCTGKMNEWLPRMTRVLLESSRRVDWPNWLDLVNEWREANTSRASLLLLS